MCWKNSALRQRPDQSSQAESMKTVLITGAARGIGLELVRQLAPTDCRILATCRNPDRAEDLRQIAEAHPGIEVLMLDVEEEASVLELARRLDGTSHRCALQQRRDHRLADDAGGRCAFHGAGLQGQRDRSDVGATELPTTLETGADAVGRQLIFAVGKHRLARSHAVGRCYRLFGKQGGAKHADETGIHRPGRRRDQRRFDQSRMGAH